MTDLELQRAEMDATIKMVSIAELLKDKVEVLQHWQRPVALNQPHPVILAATFSLS
jgi:hypothetical protein